jgi:Ni/Co efflux regulator RcnB
MKRAAVVGTLVVSLVAGSAAMAGQGYRGNLDQREPPRATQNNHQEQGRDDRGRGHDFRSTPPAPRYVYRPAPPRFGVYHAPRGYYEHSWRRGERLPAAYYSRRYEIADYRDCGLRAPPRGYHWVRVNHDAVLAAVATGVVLDAVFHLF